MPVTVHHDAHKDALAFLRRHRAGVLATADPDGEPYAAAMYFAVDDSLRVSFVTRTQTKKADNLRHNSHAMLIVYDAASQTTVQLVGTVTEIADTDEANKLFGDIIRASVETSGKGVPPIAKLKEGEYVAYHLEPSQVRMAVFSHPGSGDYEALFHTITETA